MRWSWWCLAAVGWAWLRPAGGAEPRLVVAQPQDIVSDVALSPDGRLALTGSLDGSARLWELATGRDVVRLPCGLFGAGRVGFTPDGRQAVTAGGPQASARLWDLATGRELIQLRSTRSYAMALALVPTGRFALTGHTDGSIRLWELATGREVRLFAGHTGLVHSLACSPDGRLVLSAAADGTSRLWDLATGAERRRWNNTSLGAAFALNGTAALLGGRDEAVHVWDLRTERELGRLAGAAGPLACSPDGRQVVTGTDNDMVARDGRPVFLGNPKRTARLWDVATGRELFRLEGHTQGVLAATVSRDGRQALTAGGDEAAARLWDLATGREARRLEEHAESISGVAFSPDGHRLLARCSGHGTSLWDLEQGGEISRSVAGTPPLRDAVLSRDGARVLTAGSDGLARLCEASTGRELRRLDTQWPGIRAVALSPDGHLALTGAIDCVAQLWDLDSGRRVRKLGGKNEATTSLDFSPDSRLALATHFENDALLFDVATGRELHRLLAPRSQVSGVFSPDGQLVLTGGFDHRARLWDVATGRELRSLVGHTGSVGSLCFSADGRLALTGADHTARLWEVATGRELRRFDAGTASAGSVAISPDGRLMVTGGDGATWLWSIETGTVLCSLHSFDNGDWAVVTPDGRFDTNNLDDVIGLHWVMPDEPFHALSLEVFMRDYYEPHLLPKVLHGVALPPLRSLAALNRVQPRVTLDRVARADEDSLAVTVSAAATSARLTRDGQPFEQRTAAHDLRLFRDGQLVGYAPGRLGDAWHRTFTVRVPRRRDLKSLHLAAYCFNDDRVKSATARLTYELAVPPAPRLGRAYVICVGVDAYRHRDWPALHYAVSDATAMQAALTDRLRRTDEWAGVSSVSLLSPNGGSEQATKANLRAVLARLAGHPSDSAKLQAIGAGELQPARPEDLVLLCWSGHGYAAPDGQYYLIPSDVQGNAAAGLAQAIGSDELSEWLRDIDAGELALVIDACQSSAGVEGGGFKPGPMGSRGLGQLAYDKGMSVLAASQADRPAGESGVLRHGLLTYALVEEGLGAGRAAKDGTVTLAGWLSYGVERVPALCAELAAGTFRPVSRGATLVWAGARDDAPAQRPALYRFSRGAGEVILARAPADPH